ncbi:hypothetical protein JCM10908_004087 [Rhodotorula pacifica]|uniref:F-box protein n=1 Tax=Rhodotorula pacifica TaxID=1495444 RepID=UPI003180E426
MSDTASPSNSAYAGAGSVAAHSPAQPPGTNPSANSNNGAHEAGEPARKKKKQPNRTPLGKVRGRRGALRIFNSLPLDLVVDICSYLDPADLFVLSNTSKVFRSVVTGPSSAQIWLDARARVGLPELSLPMTDLQYAALMFGGRSGCQLCGKKNAGKPEVYFRARVCTACLKSQFASPNTGKGSAAIQKAIPKAHVATVYLAPHTKPHIRDGRLVYLGALPELNKELLEAFPEAGWDDTLFLENRLGHGHPWRDPGEPSTPFQKWLVDNWLPKRDARVADGDALSAWLATQDRAKMMSKDEIRAQRKTDLETRFTAQGFGPADFTRDWREHPLVKKAEPLTDRAWARAEPILREKLSRIRAETRSRQMQDSFLLVKRRRSILAKFCPKGSVVAMLPTFQRLVADNSTASSGVQIFNANADAILDEVEALVASRLQAMIRLVADAHAELRQAQANADNSGSTPIDAMEGLSHMSVDLPRLPSWIPRTRDAPISATAEQMYAFLQSHELAMFECRKCRVAFPGGEAIQHALTEWTACTNYTGEDLQATDDWLRVGGTHERGLEVNLVTLLRTLKLKELANSIAFDCINDSYEAIAREHNIEMSEAEKFVVKYDCDCTCAGGIRKGLDLRATNSWLTRHGKTQHTVKVTARAFYSFSFTRKIDAIRTRDAWDYFGFGIGLEDDDRHYDYSDEESFYGAMGEFSDDEERYAYLGYI